MAVELATVATADLDPAILTQLRALLDRAFEGRFDDHDWDHALGGVHVIARDGDAVVGHGAVAARRLLHRGKALRTGYVEGVAVEPARQRSGVGEAIMAQVDRLVAGGYDIGALAASEAGAPLYARRGWVMWRGPLSALTPDGVRPTPDEARGVYVRDPHGRLDADAELTCDWRDGDVW